MCITPYFETLLELEMKKIGNFPFMIRLPAPSGQNTLLNLKKSLKQAAVSRVLMAFCFFLGKLGLN